VHVPAVTANLHKRDACFDEPALRAPFAVSIVADEGLAVVSNMPEASVEVEEEKSSKEEEAA